MFTPVHKLQVAARAPARGRSPGLLTLFLIGLGAWLLAAGSRAAESFLPPEAAFRSEVRALDGRTLELRLDVAPGYYLYDEQFRFEAAGARLAAPKRPPGQVVFDETFGKTLSTHRGPIRLVLPVEEAAGSFRFAATFQGCSEKGLCYPPMQLRADVSLDAPNGAIKQVRMLAGRDMPLAEAPSVAAEAADLGGFESALRSGRLSWVIVAFFAAGLLMSLTPCVLPMLPILSSLIVGHGAGVSRRRGLLLAASYSMGVAVVYTAFGLVAGLLGEGLAAGLQNPWVLGTFAALLVALGLSALDVFTVATPSRLTHRFVGLSQRFPGGRIGGVFAMGGVSALIVSPCVAAPLAGALVYLSQSRDVALGGTALFALAWGMSVPLLVVGASAGALLPKAGPWMESVKRFFALLLFGMALWTLRTVLSPFAANLLWGLLAAGAALVAFRQAARALGTSARVLPAAVGSALIGAAALSFAGLAWKSNDPLHTLQRLTGSSVEPAAALGFRTVRSSAELDAVLATTSRPVVLDFYADWCVSCREMEERTFSHPDIHARLSRAVLLKADVTGNTAADRELLRRFGLFGPPGTLFFDAQGREVSSARVIGFQDRTRFGRTLDDAGVL